MIQRFPVIVVSIKEDIFCQRFARLFFIKQFLTACFNWIV